jgi:hypothetical protein
VRLRCPGGVPQSLGAEYEKKRELEGPSKRARTTDDVERRKTEEEDQSVPGNKMAVSQTPVATVSMRPPGVLPYKPTSTPKVASASASPAKAPEKPSQPLRPHQNDWRFKLQHAAVSAPASKAVGSKSQECTAAARSKAQVWPRQSELFFLCSYCDADFRQLSHKARHMTVFHADKERLSVSRTPVCGTCREAFANDEELAVHERTHYPFNCPHCDFNSFSSKNMKEHEKKHQDKIFSCNSCGEKFASRAGKSAHERVHKRESEVWIRQKRPCTVIPAVKTETQGSNPDATSPTCMATGEGDEYDVDPADDIKAEIDTTAAHGLMLLTSTYHPMGDGESSDPPVLHHTS